jgi:GrpB-like predicted nucleotidyltransferase (UPF0157 family)/predicted enzyme related to lactoylglutathione lyase
VTQGPRELRVVITAADYEAALHFYRDVLGLSEQASFVDANGGRARLLHAGRATVEIGDRAHAQAVNAIEAPGAGSDAVRLAFEVADAEGTAARLASAGAGDVAPMVHTPWGSATIRMTAPGGQQLTLWSTDIYTAPRQRLDRQVHLADPDPGWATAGEALTEAITTALGADAPVLAHVGSTSVPGLAAKPVIDLVLGVEDPTDEAAYVPTLETLGYVLHLREPDWHQHRLLRREDPAVNLHVFAAGAPEIDRMLAFRDRLRRSDRDRELYEATKRELAARTWAFTQDYADAKSDVVADILSRAEPGDPPTRRGCFVVLSGTDRAHVSDVARALAPRLGLPLLSSATARSALGLLPDGPGSTDRHLVDLLLAIATECQGAVLDLETADGRSADLSALPGKVIRIDVAPGVDVDPGAGLRDDAALDRMASQVRQGLASH